MSTRSLPTSGPTQGPGHESDIDCPLTVHFACLVGPLSNAIADKDLTRVVCTGRSGLRPDQQRLARPTPGSGLPRVSGRRFLRNNSYRRDDDRSAEGDCVNFPLLCQPRKGSAAPPCPARSWNRRGFRCHEGMIDTSLARSSPGDANQRQANEYSINDTIWLKFQCSQSLIAFLADI